MTTSLLRSLPLGRKEKSATHVLWFRSPLKCYYDEKILFSFSVDSDFIFYKNTPCQLLRLNFKNKSDFFNYNFSFKMSAITRFCSSQVASRELDRERKGRHLLTSLIFQCVNQANIIKYAA